MMGTGIARLSAKAKEPRGAEQGRTVSSHAAGAVATSEPRQKSGWRCRGLKDNAVSLCGTCKL